MDFSILDRASPDVMPLLVRLYDSQKLDSLAKDEQPLARAELTSAIIELLEKDLNSKESDLIADVLVGLMRQAEKDLREALAERLAAMDQVPLRLVLQLANDEISIASPVLKQSPVLSDMDLIYIIKAKGPEYWRAIASRESMSHQVMNLLADKRDVATGVALAENGKIILSTHAINVLSEMAQSCDDLALPLLRREDVSAEVAQRLYKYVGEEIKDYIKDQFNISSSSIVDAVDDIILEFVDSAAAPHEFMPTPSMLKAADRYKEKGLLTLKLVLGTLRRGQISSFVAQLSRFSDLAPETLIEILSQTNGQGLAVLSKACDISREDFVSIFLLSNRTRSTERMIDLPDLGRAISYYNRITVDMAKNIMANSYNNQSPS